MTGASGFIGRHLCCCLLQKGFLVRALVREASYEKLDSHPNLELFVGDLSDPIMLNQACESIDAVVHLAGLAHGANITKEQLQKVNVNDTKCLLSAAVRKQVSRFVLMSSSLATIGSDCKVSTTDYGDSKLAAERLVLAENSLGRLEGVILRPVNVYGRGMRGNITTLISLISRRIAPPLPSLQSRISLVGVEDVSEAVALVLESKKAKGQTYLLTDGQEYRINDIEAAIYCAVGRQIPSWTTPLLLIYVSLEIAQLLGRFLRLFGIRHRILEGLSDRTYDTLVKDNLFCSKKIIEELGFKPKVTFYSSLPEIVEGIDG